MRAFRSVFVAVMLAMLPALAYGKGETVRITISGPQLKSPIVITDSRILARFIVWSGKETNPDASSGFIADWSKGPVANPPQRMDRYEVSFYARVPNEQLIYTVFYVLDPSGNQGYVYLPGKADAEYRRNVGAIYRGVEGKWFPAWNVWENAVRPLIFSAK